MSCVRLSIGFLKGIDKHHCTDQRFVNCLIYFAEGCKWDAKLSTLASFKCSDDVTKKRRRGKKSNCNNKQGFKNSIYMLLFVNYDSLFLSFKRFSHISHTCQVWQTTAKEMKSGWCEYKIRYVYTLVKSNLFGEVNQNFITNCNKTTTKC